MEEKMLIGWSEIGRFFNKTARSMIKRKNEMIKKGVIFYTWDGKPPKLKCCAFPSLLMAWTMGKSSKGEKI